MSEVLLSTFGNSATCSQGVLLDAFPVEKQGRCDDAVRPGCAFGAGRWCDPSGWITDSYPWRWVLYMSIGVRIDPRSAPKVDPSQD